MKVDPSPTTRPVHLGRQAIYDVLGDVVAYELLFRDRSDAVAATQRDSYATAQVIVAAWTEFGRTELIGERPGFINLTAPFVYGELPLPLSPAQVGVEIQADTPADAGFVAAVAALAEREFTIVIDDFRPGQDRSALLPYATYCKVDFLACDEVMVKQSVDELAAYPHVEMIAYRLENVDVLAQAMRHGCRLFQGNGLGHPHVLTTHVPAPDPDRVAELVAELCRPQPDAARVLELIVSDPAAALGLHRVAGITVTPGSVAVTARRIMDDLGLDRMAEWARLIQFLVTADPREV